MLIFCFHCSVTIMHHWWNMLCTWRPPEYTWRIWLDVLFWKISYMSILIRGIYLSSLILEFIYGHEDALLWEFSIMFLERLLYLRWFNLLVIWSSFRYDFFSFLEIINVKLCGFKLYVLPHYWIYEHFPSFVTYVIWILS